MMKQIVMILLLSSASLAGCTQSNEESLEQKYREHFEKMMKEKDIKGMSFALVSKDSTIMQINLGYSDTDLNEHVSSETLFGLGSVTKVFTGVAVMQLAEQGKVELDHPLKEYLPQFNIKGEHSAAVTVRNVMTHHSGLPSDIIKGMFTQNPENYDAVVGYMNREYMANQPGQIRAYSNPGYTLLGHMVAEVAEKDYPEYMRDELLLPLGMHRSGFNLRDEASATFDSKGKAKKDVLLRDLPAGGLYSNTEEMALFLKSFLNRDERLLSNDGYRQIFTQQHPDLPLNFGNRYALGWNLSSMPHAGDMYMHTGTTMYFNSAVVVAPEVGLAAVILTNSHYGGSAFKSIKSVIDDAAKEMGHAPQEKEKIESFATTELIELPEALTDQYVGIYGVPGAIIDVYKKREKLFAEIQGFKVRLLPVEDNVFIPKLLIFGFIPMKMNEDRFVFENISGYDVITQMELGSSKELMAVKIDVNEISENWKNRIGSYEAVNKLEGELDFFTDFELIEKHGLLVMTLKQGDQDIEMALDIVNDSRAKVAGLGRYAGQSLQAENNDHLRFFGLELLKMNE